MRRTRALSQRILKLRLKFLGSRFVPVAVVKTRSSDWMPLGESRTGFHRGPAASLAAVCHVRVSSSAAKQISGNRGPTDATIARARTTGIDHAASSSHRGGHVQQEGWVPLLGHRHRPRDEGQLRVVVVMMSLVGYRNSVIQRESTATRVYSRGLEDTPKDVIMPVTWPGTGEKDGCPVSGGQGVAGSNPAVPTRTRRSEATSPVRRGGFEIV